MHTLKIKCCRSDIWLDDRYQILTHNLNLLLRLKDTLIILSSGHPPFDAVIGVPHQAAIGCPKIAETQKKPGGGFGRSSDENAASYALVLFSELERKGHSAKLVIACHFTDHDPNKAKDSPYCLEVLSQTNRLLLECHGAGASQKNDIEISSGSNPHIKALAFGRQLADRTGYGYKIAAQRTPGSSKGLCFDQEEEKPVRLALPALKTTSLKAAGKLGIPALHLEAKPRFRIPKEKGRSVTGDGAVLGKAFAYVVSSWTGDARGA